MPVKWNLRERLREQGITSATQVSKIVRERTGYVLSTQAVCDLLNDQPKMLRIETSQALCDAFDCRLSDFLEVAPRAVSRSNGNKGGLLGTASFFPDARKSDQNLGLNLSPQSLDLLQQLKRRGIFGRTESEIAERFVDKQLRDLIVPFKLDLKAPSKLPIATIPDAPILPLTAGQQHPSAETVTSPGTITLPPDVYQIRPNEPLQRFIKRIQVAAITAATAAEGNHTKAARRLGYSRPAMLHLLQKIRESERDETQRTRKTTSNKKSTKKPK